MKDTNSIEAYDCSALTLLTMRIYALVISAYKT